MKDKGNQNRRTPTANAKTELAKHAAGDGAVAELASPRPRPPGPGLRPREGVAPSTAGTGPRLHPPAIVLSGARGGVTKPREGAARATAGSGSGAALAHTRVGGEEAPPEEAIGLDLAPAAGHGAEKEAPPAMEERSSRSWQPYFSRARRRRCARRRSFGCPLTVDAK